MDILKADNASDIKLIITEYAILLLHVGILPIVQNDSNQVNRYFRDIESEVNALETTTVE